MDQVGKLLIWIRSLRRIEWYKAQSSGMTVALRSFKSR